MPKWQGLVAFLSVPNVNPDRSFGPCPIPAQPIMDTHTMTKAAFLAAYRLELSRYSWAENAPKLATFLDSVAGTLNGPTATWNHTGEAVKAAWRAIGGKGKPTLKALRSLPPA
jgi:hypothetical protein